MATSVRRDLCPKASVQGARVQKASVKRASTLQQPASLRAVNWRRKARPIVNEKPSRLLGPSVAPVVLFVLGIWDSALSAPSTCDAGEGCLEGLNSGKDPR